MRTRANWYLGAIALALTGIGSGHAQDRAAVMVDISVCIDLPERAARSACYEALAEEARGLRRSSAAQEQAQPQAPAAVVVAPVPAVPVAPPAETAAESQIPDNAVASFGVVSPAAAASVVDGAEGQAELHDRITDLQEREPGRWLITLASGQIWYQSNSGRIRLRKDMAVRIYPSPLGGSFRLAGLEGSTGFIQVTRVK